MPSLPQVGAQGGLAQRFHTMRCRGEVTLVIVALATGNQHTVGRILLDEGPDGENRQATLERRHLVQAIQHDQAALARHHLGEPSQHDVAVLVGETGEVADSLGEQDQQALHQHGDSGVVLALRCWIVRGAEPAFDRFGPLSIAVAVQLGVNRQELRRAKTASTVEDIAPHERSLAASGVADDHDRARMRVGIRLLEQGLERVERVDKVAVIDLDRSVRRVAEIVLPVAADLLEVVVDLGTHTERAKLLAEDLTGKSALLYGTLDLRLRHGALRRSWPEVPEGLDRLAGHGEDPTAHILDDLALVDGWQLDPYSRGREPLLQSVLLGAELGDGGGVERGLEPLEISHVLARNAEDNVKPSPAVGGVIIEPPRPHQVVAPPVRLRDRWNLDTAQSFDIRHPTLVHVEHVAEPEKGGKPAQADLALLLLGVHEQVPVAVVGLPVGEPDVVRPRDPRDLLDVVPEARGLEREQALVRAEVGLHHPVIGHQVVVPTCKHQRLSRERVIQGALLEPTLGELGAQRREVFRQARAMLEALELHAYIVEVHGCEEDEDLDLGALALEGDLLPGPGTQQHVEVRTDALGVGDGVISERVIERVTKNKLSRCAHVLQLSALRIREEIVESSHCERNGSRSGHLRRKQPGRDHDRGKIRTRHDAPGASGLASLRLGLLPTSTQKSAMLFLSRPPVLPFGLSEGLGYPLSMLQTTLRPLAAASRPLSDVEIGRPGRRFPDLWTHLHRPEPPSGSVRSAPTGLHAHSGSGRISLTPRSSRAIARTATPAGTSPPGRSPSDRQRSAAPRLRGTPSRIPRRPRAAPGAPAGARCRRPAPVSASASRVR